MPDMKLTGYRKRDFMAKVIARAEYGAIQNAALASKRHRKTD